jgi:hypothetical protein
MRHRARLILEQLEDRCTPSALGQPWPSPNQLTLSFAPDGTLVNGASSNLFATLNRVAPTSQWQQVMLKGFQSWVPYANINIGLVPDGGQPFGTNGSVQGDTRFGDIRVGMAALPANLVATTSPFSWTGSTWSGDVILNSSYTFCINGGGQYDLFTVAAHEAGHALGIPDNSTDASSMMYASYTGPRSSLDSLDIANVQALYGARTADAFDAAHANDTLASATSIDNSHLGFNADITTPTDVDWYRVVSPLVSLLGTVTFRIGTPGQSLLMPTVSVFNGSGHLLATQTATSVFSNTLSVTVSNVLPLTTYYFAVSSSGTNFNVGGYSGQVIYTYPLQIITDAVPWLIQGVVNTVDHLNTSISTATGLTSAFDNTSDQRFSYLYEANLAYGGDADYYEFTAPATSSNTGAYALDAMAWQTTPGGLAPVLHFFDSKGNPIAAQIMGDTSSEYSLQLFGITPGQKYYVEVAGQTSQGASSTGFYVLGIKFNQLPETVAPPMGSGTLATASSTDTGVLSMNQNGVFYFELAATDQSPTSSSNVTMTVVDANGNAMTSLTVPTAAAARTTAAYLPAGTYSIVYSITSVTGTYAPASYWLSGEILSDPIGPYYSGSSAPPSSSSTTTSGSNGSSTIGATKTFASAGASVTISAPSGTISVPIPPPGGSATYTFTTSVGTTTVTLTSDSHGNTTLSLTTPSRNSITDTVSTSGNTSTETLTTSDGIQVTIVTPVTNGSATYSGSTSGTSAPYHY